MKTANTTWRADAGPDQPPADPPAVVGEKDGDAQDQGQAQNAPQQRNHVHGLPLADPGESLLDLLVVVDDLRTYSRFLM